jgi:peroxiredoxin
VKIKNGISQNMQPFIDRIEAKYNQFNGTPAPPFYLKDLDDQLVSLKDFRGNLVLLDFWFVGCSFCKKELPFTKKLIEEFKDKNFKVIQICMRSDQDDWEKLKKDLVGIPLYSNAQWDKKLTNSYKLAGYPRYVLVDEEGIILEGWCERPSEPALKSRIENYFLTVL